MMIKVINNLIGSFLYLKIQLRSEANDETYRVGCFTLKLGDLNQYETQSRNIWNE